VYKKLEEYADTVPANERLPAHPFTGIVLNLNATTVLHRDDKDAEDLCMVVVISDCTGGGLGFTELGIVVEMENGDSSLFRSSKLTHFNEHYQGWRASLVLHTDGSFGSWTHGNRNNWGSNKHFRRS
jgi:hypothetical protein